VRRFITNLQFIKEKQVDEYIFDNQSNDNKGTLQWLYDASKIDPENVLRL
jgi:hypothetical protein